MTPGIVLCVDDEPTVLNALRFMLVSHFGDSVMVELAESGAEGLEICDELRRSGREVSVVVSDYIMPGMRGDEFLTRLHLQSPRTVTVLLTGQSDLEGVKRAVNEANLYRFLEKPLENTDFILTARAALQFYAMSKELSQRNEQLQAMLAGIPIPFFIKDAQSRFLMMNAACEDQWGVRLDDVRDTNGSKVFPPEHVAYALVKDQMAFEQGHGFDYEEVVWDNSRQQNRMTHTFKNPVFDVDGKPLYLVCASIDITEQRQSQAALSESVRSLNEAQMIARLGSYVADMKNRTWQSSENMDAVFGIDSTFTKTLENWECLVVPEQVQGLREHCANASKGNGIFDYQYEIIRPGDGQRRWISDLATFAYDADGNPSTMKGTIQDITERKQAELLREQKELAEATNRAKFKFLAAASHDLRQPIHAQGLFLEVLSRTPLTPHQRDVLANARSASLASSDMLNTLLDYSRIEAGAVKPDIQPFSLAPLLAKIKNDLAPLADDKNLAYRSHETTLAVNSDPALVEMVLRNLISNAIRYTRHGGILVGCRLRGGAVIVEVWDTGIGIEPVNQVDIFREFYQLGNPERDRNNGLGIGLAIVRGLTNALQHELSLSSKPGKGSVFKLHLPLSRLPDSAVAPALLPDAERLRGVHILVIDDDAMVRSSMAYFLRGCGGTCDVAGSVGEALAMARNQTPDMVISDYRLRGADTGNQAVTAVRSVLGAAIPALIITGDTDPQRLRELLASNVALLHKPVASGQLLRALVMMLELG